MKALVDGIRRFRREGFRERRSLFERLATGQQPRILLITCSDSRISPELITSSEPGELFVIRNAGNIMPPYGVALNGEEATLEYAVSVLGVEHIVVCGHSDCGAMKGLLNPDSVAALPAVASWLELARPAREIIDATFGSNISADDRLMRTIEMNTLRQLDTLRGHPSVAAALARNAVSLHAWVYNIGTGAVNAYEESKRSFIELNETLHPVGGHLSLVATA